MKVVPGRLVLRREEKQVFETTKLTQVQKAQNERGAEKLAVRIRKNLTKPFRERLRQHNNFLESLNTHFEIPKVGPFG